MDMEVQLRNRHGEVIDRVTIAPGAAVTLEVEAESETRGEVAHTEDA